MKILLIEDEDEIALFVQKGLQSQLFTVDVAPDGKQGEVMAFVNGYDAIIVDNNLPSKSGIDICKSLRSAGKHFPIIMLTAESEVEKKVKAFNCGVNDYVTKPFAIEELTARLRSLLRKKTENASLILTQKNVVMDLENYTVSRKNKIILLRKKEFSLLEYFLRNPDTILTRSMILEHVWETNADPFTNTVDVHVRTLRKKLNEGFSEKLIETVHGMGYRF